MITQKRKEYLRNLWGEETNEEWTQEWRDELTAEEAAMVEHWDDGYDQFYYEVMRRIQES